jgi:hypothetical protein
MRPITLLGVLLLAAIPSNLESQPTPDHRKLEIVQTSCDLVSLEPLLYQVEVSVSSLNDFTTGCAFMLAPIDLGSASADSCGVVGCDSPPEWRCANYPSVGLAQWIIIDTYYGTGCIEPNHGVESFSFLIERTDCCYLMYFESPVFESYGLDTLCVECDEYVQALDCSWGDVKSIYR